MDDPQSIGADEAAQNRGRMLDLLVPLGCAVGAVVIFPADIEAVAAVGGGLAGAAGRWAFGEERRAARVAKKKQKPSKQARHDLYVLQALPVPLLLIDANGVITHATNEAERMLERRLVGLHIPSVFRAPALLAAIEDAASRMLEAELDFRVRRPREMILTATIRCLTFDGPERVALLLHDSTNRVRIEDARSDFVANASHELRTPLAAVSGLVETLQGQAKDDPAAQQRFLGLIAKQTARMTRLVNDLLSLSRIEADENILPSSEQDIGVILTEALSAIASVADAAKAQVEAEIPASLPKIRGSRDELVQVFVNLIENGIKYAGANSPIRVAVQHDERMLSVTVSDRGPGIDPAHIPRLTERFFRADPADSDARGGTGLGLAIVKHIISRHRGTLAIESTPGEGAAFVVSLPLAKALPPLPS